MITQITKKILALLLILSTILILCIQEAFAGEEDNNTNTTNQAEIAPALANENALLEPFKLELIKTDNYPLALEETLDLAVKNNIQVQSTDAQLRIDQLDKYVKLSEFLPTLTPSFDQFRFQGAMQIFGNETFKIYRSSIEPKGAISYTIFSGGETVFNYIEAKRRQKATEYSLYWLKDKLLHDTTIAYYELQKAYKALEIADNELQESRKILELNSSRLENGLGTILEVTQSETQLASSKYSVIQANKNIALASQNLNYILNLPVNLKIVPASTEIQENHIFTNENLQVDKFLNIAFENRNDLKQEKEIKKVYLAQKNIALSKFFPTVNFYAYLNGNGPSIADLGQGRMIGYTVQLDFLKNMGVNYIANYKKSKPMLKQADLQIEAKIREIEKNIADSLLEYESSLKEIEVARQGLISAQKSFEYATERLNAGVGTNIDLLSAQVQQTRARFGVLDSIISHNKSQISLLYYLGIISKDKILSLKEAFSDIQQPNSGNNEAIK